jgi:hypothetical protein
MATLTPSDIEYIRAMSGDDCGNPDDYEVSDSLLQKLYDRALTWDACGCAADSLDLGVIQVLRVRVARAQKLYDESSPEGTRASVSQKRAHLEKDLERWESKCGLSGGVVTIGTLSMGLDTQSIDEFSNTDLYPPYGGYYS